MAAKKYRFRLVCSLNINFIPHYSCKAVQINSFTHHSIRLPSSFHMHHIPQKVQVPFWNDVFQINELVRWSSCISMPPYYFAIAWKLMVSQVIIFQRVSQFHKLHVVRQSITYSRLPLSEERQSSRKLITLNFFNVTLISQRQITL